MKDTRLTRVKIRMVIFRVRLFPLQAGDRLIEKFLSLWTGGAAPKGPKGDQP